MFKYFCLAAALVGATVAGAQTPEQLEMLRRRQEQAVETQPSEPVTVQPTARIENAATPASVEARMLAQQRMQNQDKLVITTGQFRILESATGMKLCTLDLGLTNYTQYPVEEVQIFFGWGEVETYAVFSGVTYEQTAKMSIGLAGSVCDRITEDPNLRTTTCRLQGASESFCRAAIVFNQG